MANVYRVAILLFLLLPSLAFANFPYQKKYTIQDGSGYFGYLFNQALCEGKIPAEATYQKNYRFYSIDTVALVCRYAYDNTVNYPTITTGYVNKGYTMSNTTTCPAGSTVSAGSCSCNVGYTQNATNNGCNTNCLAYRALSGVYDIPTSTLLNQSTTLAQFKAATSGCLDGCTTKADPAGVPFVPNTNPNGTFSLTANLKQTGQNCTTGTLPVITTQTETQKDCLAQGKSYGTVNGTTVCLSQGSSGSQSTLSTNEKTTTGTGQNPTTTASTNTVNNDNTVTTNTTTTVTNTDGSTTTTEGTSNQDMPSFCAENPDSQICKDVNKSDWHGTCAAYFCDGDAIQCAISNRIHRDRCEADTAKTQLEEKSTFQTGQNLVDGQYDQDVQEYMDGEGDSHRIVDVPSSLSESGSLSFGNQGISDVSISLPNGSLNLPMTNTNNVLSVMGYILLALSYFAAYKIVSRDI